MSTPHTCPRCEGEGKIVDQRTRDWKDCPVCHSKGVVWEHAAEEAAQQESPMEINGL